MLVFPSSLEVDVIDVTDLCKDVDFMMPLSLTEIMSQPDESLPAVVEILEEPQNRSLFKSSWLQGLTKSTHLVLHKKRTTALVVLSSLKGRKAQQYFLVSQQYGGRFRRQPREFNSVYELYVASTQAQGLTVSVTKNCEEVEEEGLPALSVGEKLEIVDCTRMELQGEGRKEQTQSVEALLCRRLQEPEDADDDDDSEEEVTQKEENDVVLMPLYMQGHFVEVLRDNKKHKLSDLSKDFSSPLDVKAASRDTELETDPLVGFTCLRIEGVLLEPTIQASFPHTPDHCFELPVNWLLMTVCFTKEPLPWPEGQGPNCSTERLTEVSDTFFYEFRKQANTDEAPPPRPPKRDLPSLTLPSKKSSKASKKSSKPKKSKPQEGQSVPADQFSTLTLNKKRTPAPPPPQVSMAFTLVTQSGFQTRLLYCISHDTLQASFNANGKCYENE